MTEEIIQAQAFEPKKPSRRLLFYMILSQLGGALTLLVWPVFLSAGVMGYDQGPNPMVDKIFYSILLYPIFPIGCAILAWILYAFKLRKAAAIVTSLPLIPLALLVILFVAMTVYSAIRW